MTIQKFDNVRHIRINGKKYSHDSNAWIYDGELFCEGWQINKEWISMKQLSIKDFSNAYEFKQAKKQVIKQCNALKNERKNKRIFIK